MPFLRTTVFAALSLVAPIGSAAQAQQIETSTDSAVNELLVGAVDSLERAEDVQGLDLSKSVLRHSLLDQAKGAVDEVLSDHSGSQYALTLALGGEVGPLSRKDLEMRSAQARANVMRVLSECVDIQACLETTILNMAQSLNDPAERARRLAELAVQKRDPELLKQVMESHDFGNRAEDIWRDLFRGIAGEREIHLVKDVYESIPAYARDPSMQLEIVNALSKMGLYSEAITEGARIEDAFLGGDNVLSIIASNQGEQGLIQDAIKTASLMSNLQRKEMSLSSIATITVDRGAIDEALDIISGLSDENARCIVLSQVGVRHARDDLTQEAFEIAKEQAASREKGSCYVNIATEQFDNGHGGDAIETLLLVPEDDSSSIDRGKEIHIEFLLRNDNYDGALDIATSIENDRKRVQQLKDIGVVLAGAGNVDMARHISSVIPEKYHRYRGLVYRSIYLSQLDYSVPILFEDIAPEISLYVTPYVLAEQARQGNAIDAIDAALALNIFEDRFPALLQINRALSE